MKNHLPFLLNSIKNKNYKESFQIYKTLSQEPIYGSFLDFNKKYILKKLISRDNYLHSYVSERHPNTPKISVIVPLYNKQDFINSCLNSIIKQNLEPIEIIVVDDGSTDGSLYKVLELALEYDNIKVFSGPNRGAAFARNAALKEARGEYVAFMDADDFYADYDSLKNLYMSAIQTKAVIVGGSLHEWKQGKLIPSSPEFSFYKFSKNAWIKFNTFQYDYGFTRFIYKRSFLFEKHIFFPLLKVQEDPIFLIRALHHAKFFYSLQAPFYIYRKTSSARLGSSKECIEMLKGYRYELLFSRKYKYRNLHRLLLNRLHSNYIYSSLNNFIDDKDLQLHLLKTLNSIDYKFATESTISQNILTFYSNICNNFSTPKQKNTVY